ncbi:MAG: ATP-binding protein [Blastopirellula sp.]|nr:MAG: ATP-binding protein [Blastopirellula sp.]
MADLEVKDLRKEFPTRGEPLVVLRQASLELNRGQNAAILGPSGSGKSTLLYCIGTLDTPTEGQILLDGNDPFELNEPSLADFRNQQIGFIFQDHHLLPQLSVLENVLVPVLATGAANKEATDRAKHLIDLVGLSDRIEHRSAELSGGERQRVAVARSLILKPSLLLADEPTGNLDRTNAMAVGELLIDLQKQENTMLLVVTHSLELAEMCEQEYQIDNGTLHQQPAKG